MSSAVQPFRGSYLMPAFEHATVADVMRPGVMSCPPDASLQSVAQTMATHHVHSLVVGGITDHHLVWGVISDRELLHAAREGIEGRTAEDIVRSPAATIEANTPLGEAARVMEEAATAHLVVVDRQRPVGVISTLDIAGALAWGRG